MLLQSSLLRNPPPPPRLLLPAREARPSQTAGGGGGRQRPAARTDAVILLRAGVSYLGGPDRGEPGQERPALVRCHRGSFEPCRHARSEKAMG